MIFALEPISKWFSVNQIPHQVGHSSIKPIVNHYYNLIPGVEDGQKLEEALKYTRVLPDLINPSE
jgi:hypothetical protein